MASELEELAAALRKQPNSSELAIKFLRAVREVKIKDPESVLLCGGAVLQKSRSQLSEEELWLVHEQVAVAALALGEVKYAHTLILAVAKRFPESMRANRLKGMYWEAQGNFDHAEQIYKDMLAQQPACEIAAKRMCALEKSKGNLSAAADNLRKYLDVWPSDRDAWEELAEIYVELLMYRQAVFCYEELLTLAPGHAPFLIRLADVLYTLGGSTNLRVARSYFSKALELSGGNNTRALWGVLACCTNNTEKVSLQDSLTRSLIELPGLAADALQSQYRTNAPDKLGALQRMLGETS